MKKITLSKIRLAAMFIVLMALLSASAFAELSASINVDFSTASINIGGSSLILVDVSGYGGLVTSRLEVFRGDSLEYSGGLGFQMSDFTMDDWRVPLQNTQEGLHTFRFTITDSGGQTAEASMDVYVSAGGLSYEQPTGNTPAPSGPSLLSASAYNFGTYATWSESGLKITIGASGGVAPYSYSVILLRDGVEVFADVYDSPGDIGFTAATWFSGLYRVNLTVTDNNGTQASATAALQLDFPDGSTSVTPVDETTPTPHSTATPRPTAEPTAEPTSEPTAEPTVTPAPALPGDATADGTIDILDLVSIIDYIVSNTDPASLTNADANGDGSVDILDLVWIIDQIVGG